LTSTCAARACLNDWLALASAWHQDEGSASISGPPPRSTSIMAFHMSLDHSVWLFHLQLHFAQLIRCALHAIGLSTDAMCDECVILQCHAFCTRSQTRACEGEWYYSELHLGFRSSFHLKTSGIIFELLPMTQV